MPYQEIATMMVIHILNNETELMIMAPEIQINHNANEACLMVMSVTLAVRRQMLPLMLNARVTSSRADVTTADERE